jgi:neutral ceramidase
MNKELLAGAAQVDITPRMGTQLAGDVGRRRPAEILIDPLFAKALVLDDGERRLCILSLDLATITREWSDKIRNEAKERFGLDPEGVMVHAVQNHAAPAVGHFFFNLESEYVPPELSWLKGGDDEYHPVAVERTVEAIGLALENMQPVRVGIAAGVENRVAFNRRFVMRDGTAEMGFGGHPPSDVAYNEGPIDPELGVVSFTTESLQPVALLLHHTCHPVHGYPERYITAGWPGAWSSGIRAMYGDECVPLVINGCCGNVHHSNYLNPAHVDTAERMGATLTQATMPVLKRLIYQDDSSLDWGTRIAKIPLRGVTEQQLAEAKALLAQHPTPMWKEGGEGIAADWGWVFAVGRIDLDRLVRQDPYFDYEIQVLRIGDFALVALMGEPFVEGQLRLKMESPAARTFVAHHSHGFLGYIPTPQALGRGGYEVNVHTAKLAPEALDTIVDNSVELLKSLFA